MEDEEIEIIIKEENGKSHIIKIQNYIKFKILRQKIEKLLNINNIMDQYIIQQGNKNFDDDDEYIDLDSGSEIYLMKRGEKKGGQKEDKFMNCNFFEKNKEDSDDEIVEKQNLSGILKLCLLKYISRYMDEDTIKKIQNEKMRNIIVHIKKEIAF